MGHKICPCPSSFHRIEVDDLFLRVKIGLRPTQPIEPGLGKVLTTRTEKGVAFHNHCRKVSIIVVSILLFAALYLHCCCCFHVGSYSEPLIRSLKRPLKECLQNLPLPRCRGRSNLAKTLVKESRLSTVPVPLKPWQAFGMSATDVVIHCSGIAEYFKLNATAKKARVSWYVYAYAYIIIYIYMYHIHVYMNKVKDSSKDDHNDSDYDPHFGRRLGSDQVIS